MKRTTTSELRELLEQMRAEMAQLADRVARLEGKPLMAEPKAVEPPKAEPQPLPAPAPAPPAIVATEPLADDTIAAIAAAVAAFMGERVRIRQIRVLGSPAWAQQGRVSIQASHRLH